jgi:ActR/RegA family two-component response regulator
MTMTFDESNVENMTLQGRRILVIEDDYLVAQVICSFLEEAGAEIVGPIGWVDEAIAFIKSHCAAFDGAVLDVNLHGQKSYPIADSLLAHHVGFVFTTGYGADAVEAAYRHYPRCEKPLNQQAIVAALATIRLGSL